MRKYLIAAIAALTVVAMTGTAVAQDEAELSVKVTPTNAGTKKKPKNAKIRFQVTNNNSQRTLSQLRITAPSTIKVSGRGLTKCSESVIENEGPDGCPRASRVGTGVANALLGVNGPSPSPLTFDVTAIVMGSNSIGFHLHGRELPGLNLLAPGRVSGRNLTIQVPEQAQMPAPSVFAGLVSINATLGGKKGKRYLVSSTGCKSRSQAFSTVLTFRDNGVAPAGNVEAEASSRCSK